MPDPHDQAQLRARDEKDPQRAIVTALEKAEKLFPGCLTAKALAFIDAWRDAEALRKDLANEERKRAAGAAKGEVSGG